MKIDGKRLLRKYDHISNQFPIRFRKPRGTVPQTAFLPDALHPTSMDCDSLLTASSSLLAKILRFPNNKTQKHWSRDHNGQIAPTVNTTVALLTPLWSQFDSEFIRSCFGRRWGGSFRYWPHRACGIVQIMLHINLVTVSARTSGPNTTFSYLDLATT